MATHLVRPTNGVSFGVKHVLTASDLSDAYVVIDFQVDYDLAACVMLTTSAGVGYAMTFMDITYPATGQVRIDVDSDLSSGDILHVVANRDYNSSNPY